MIASSRPLYDLAIIGGGPAGSTAAAYARQAGLSVIVIEREPFPRFRIGESLLPAGNTLLREIGAWEKVEAAGFIKKRGALFHTADGSRTREVVFSRGVVPGLTYTYQVERAKFDALLLDHAASLGAETRLATTVTAVASDPAGHTLTLHPADGSANTTVRTRFPLDASGRDHFVPLELKQRLSPLPFPKRIAIYTHLTGIKRPRGFRAGHTVIVRLDDGWFWLIPIDATRTSVGLVTTSAALRASGRTPAEAFWHEVRRSAQLTALMAQAEPTREFTVTADYSYFREKLASERLLLLGDAGGFYDPIFSSGVYLAGFSARAAVAAVVRAHREDRPLRPAEQATYTRRIRRHADVFRHLITAFYDNASFSVFMTPRAPLGIDRGVNSIVAGHARLTWPIWWRFQLFRLTCRLQKRFTLVPRIESALTSGVTA